MVHEHGREIFENEFTAHSRVDNEDLSYTAFGSAAVFGDTEVYAVRTGHAHSTDFKHKSLVSLYFYRSSGDAKPTKKVIFISPPSEDVRDVNITRHPNRESIALISFAQKLKAGGYQTRLIVFNVRTRVTESNRLIGGLAKSDYKWGNVLITKNGELLFSSYSTSGMEIRVWRSVGSFLKSGPVNVKRAHTFADQFASEPTLGYWRDRLVIFYRRTGAASRLSWTTDLTGASGWKKTVFPHGVSSHAPALPPYSNASVWTAFFSLGTDRSYIGSTSSNDLKSFKSQAVLRLPGNAIGGYPSVIPIPGGYAVSFYSEHLYDAASAPRTRFERAEIDKTLVDYLH